MSHKISGYKSAAARIIVLEQVGWTVEANTVISGSGDYEVLELTSNDKIVIAIDNNDEAKIFAGVTPIVYTPSSYNRGVFGAGTNGSYLTTIDYISIDTLGNAQSFGSMGTATGYMGATSNATNQRGLFDSGNGLLNSILYITIDTPGNAQSFGNLVHSAWYQRATSNDVGNRGIMAGGLWSSGLQIIQYVTISTLGNAATFGNLTLARPVEPCSNSDNNRAVFSGGTLGSGNYDVYNTMDYITITSLSDAQDFGDLTVARYAGGATSNGNNNKGIVGGGKSDNTTDVSYDIIDRFNISSIGNAQEFSNLTVVRHGVSACSNRSRSNRGVFGGGTWRFPDSSYYNVIDYVDIQTANTAQDFGNLTNSRGWVAATSN